MENNGVEFEANIIGRGQIYSQMKELYDSLNLKQVAMNGEIIDEKKLAKKIREHDIILGIFGESIKAKSVVPNKLYQAVASKKTIVTMKSNAIEEFFDKEDLIVCTNTPKQLSKELSNLINNRELLYTTATNGYNKFIQIYKKTQNDFEDFIKQIDRGL